MKKKEINSKEIKSYNTSYYCGSLTDFVFIYNNYYQRIPLEQKRIFNIKSNPLEYFYHNYYPKIIICSDNKLSLTKGICIYSILFNYENKPNKIIIEHISSYNQEEMNNILKNIFDFLKNNNILSNTSSNDINTEIFIDLYFYLENEKFIIDANIRDFIKNELKFKWVKLENISKEIRFQKMKHQFNNNKNILNNEIDDNNILNQSIIAKKALKDLNNENEDIFDEKESNICNFYIKNKSVIKYINKSEQEKKIKKEDKLIFNNIKYINPFSIIYLIKKISEDCIYSEYIENNTYNFFNINEHLDIEEILNNNDGTSLDDILTNNTFFNSDLEQLKEYFNIKYNKKEKIDKNKFNINAKMNIFPLFDNCISVKYRHYYYN